ncbi:nuclear transport factor 2 family protein [Streptacidiphilus sp. PAMC 29251]
MIEIEALLRTHVEAFNTRDLERLMAGFAEDAVWITGRTRVRGRAELTELFAGAMEGLLPTLTIQNLIVGQDRAACQMVEVFTFDGAERTDHIAGFYGIANGRITSAKIYREGSADVD